MYDAKTGEYVVVKRKVTSNNQDRFARSSDSTLRKPSAANYSSAPYIQDRRKHINSKSNNSKNSIYMQNKVSYYPNKKRKHAKSNITKPLAIGLATIGTIGTILGFAFNPNNNNPKVDSPVFAPTITYDDLLIENRCDESLTDKVNGLFLENEDLYSANLKIQSAIDTFSSQLGEDGLSLINERVELLGGSEVKTIDVLKLLWIESNGRIYDDNGEYITSYTGQAFGPFQLTPDTVDYINNYYGLDKPLDVMNPYDNLDACILNLKFLKAKKLADSENSLLPTGENIMDAVFWGYHDGAWATDITKQGEEYLAKYRDLSIVDDYPDVVAYITNGLC